MTIRNGYTYFADAGLALFVFAALGVAEFLFADLPGSRSASPALVRAANQHEPKAIAPDLVRAIRNADAEAICKLIDSGADVNGRDAEGNTPLILGSLYANPKCVGLLLEKGADVNAANRAGVTALVRAATNYEKALLLLNAGAKAGVRTADFGNTPLVLAARRAGNSRTVKLLLEHGASAIERNNAGLSPIISGAASGDLETVRLLIDAGAKAEDFPQSKNPGLADVAAGFRSPLMWAAYFNDVRMVRYLLEHGADPNRSNFFGSPLSHACWNDSFEAALLLIDRGANVNARDRLADFTPLHWAAGSESQSTHLVTLLLASGADPNAAGGGPVEAFGLALVTPRLIAEKRGRTGIVGALEAAGAKQSSLLEIIGTPKRALPETLDHSTLISSVEKALAALQSTAAKSRESFLRHVSKQDCASCHQQYLPMAAVGHARNRSVRFDRAAAQEQIESLAKLTSPFSQYEFITQALIHPDPAHTFGYHLFGFAAEGIPPSSATDAMVHHLVTIQASDGRWFHMVPRPPMASGDTSATALAIQAIKRYGWQGRKEEFASSIEHARRWLWKVDSETNEEMIFQLLGLHWAGEPAERLTCLVKSLVQKQRNDGGWAQLPTLGSDAYATGEALYALAQVEIDPSSDPAWQRGLRFLLERQETDGTWHVARRTFPFQPTMNSGFPHHRDSWISAAATSWAVLALTQAAPAGSASGKPAVERRATTIGTAKNDRKIDFAQQIKPLFEQSCASCHSGQRPRGMYRIDGRDAILKGGASGEAAIVPGHSEKSPLIDYVSDNVPDSEMPPKSQRKKFPALRTADIALLRAWIDQGANWPKDVLITTPIAPRRSRARR
jgi:ankyrin repeat protein/mono/diheme cytochrome c family protein